MGFDLEQHMGLDPHVEISREELELGLPPSFLSDDLTGVQDAGYRIDTPTTIGTGDLEFLRGCPDGGILASSTSATDLQQGEVVPAADDPGSQPDIMSWSQISMCEAPLKGMVAEEQMTRIDLNLRSDTVQQEETAIFCQPPDPVAASYSVLSVENLTEYNHKAANESSPKTHLHGNDAPVCKVPEVAQYQGNVGKSGDSSEDIIEGIVREILSEDSPKETSKRPSVLMDHSIEKGCVETDPDLGSSALPTSFSGLFKSVLTSECPSSQLVEVASQPNGPSAASSSVTRFTSQAFTDMVNTTTRLMLDNLNKSPPRLDPPGLLQVGNAPETRKRTKPNTALAAMKARPASLPIRSAPDSSYREARVSSAANAVSAAALAAKSAVQAAEASFEALANLGINNGSLYQQKNSFVNPQPLQVACGSRPVAAGGKISFEDLTPPNAEQNGSKNATGALDLIKVGSAVEVMPEEAGLQGGWFFAKVLSMTSRKALVVYDDLMTDDGRSQLEESFPLNCSREEESFGITVAGSGWIRPVHPLSSSLKRGQYVTTYDNWVVGDRVDAFVEDVWWEAIIEDLDEADETRITVFFPGDGSTSIVKAWNVRPSFVWKKGVWRPCSGDSVEQACPPPKRQKTSSNMERDQGKTKVAAAEKPVLALKSTPEPLAPPRTTRSAAKRGDENGLVLYSKEKDAGQALVTPARETRSAARSKTSVAHTKTPVNSRTTPSTKTRAPSRATPTTSTPATRSRQTEVAATPELTWDVRRQSTRLQQKQTPEDLEKGKTPSSRLSKKAVLEKKVVLESPRSTPSRKTPSRRSAGEKALAIVAVPETRSRTRSQMSRTTKK